MKKTTIKKLKLIAENLDKLFSTVLKISSDDYRIVVSDRLDGIVDVYFRDFTSTSTKNMFSRIEVTIALQTIDCVMPDSWRIAIHWVSSKHEQFDGRKTA